MWTKQLKTRSDYAKRGSGRERGGWGPGRRYSEKERKDDGIERVGGGNGRRRRDGKRRMAGAWESVKVPSIKKKDSCIMRARLSKIKRRKEGRRTNDCTGKKL